MRNVRKLLLLIAIACFVYIGGYYLYKYLMMDHIVASSGRAHYFAGGPKRAKRTEDMTLDYLDSFKDESNGTPCACMVYSVSGKY